MLQKNSLTINSDNTGVKKLKVFHVYQHGKGKLGTINFIMLGAIKKKTSKDIKLIKKYVRTKTYNCIIRTVYFNLKNDKQFLGSYDNATAIFSKKLDRYKLKIRGPLFFNIKRIRYYMLAKYII